MKEPTFLDTNFLQSARFLADWSAMLDDIDILIRKQALNLTVDYRAFMRLLVDDEKIGKLPAEKKGAPAVYTSEVCDRVFLDWHRINPIASQEQRIAHLRDVYRERGLRVGTDKTAKIEIKKIRALTG